jgi:hypothetical protein
VTAARTTVRELEKAIDIVDCARDLIGTRARWTRGVPARDARGRRVEVESPRAVRFCLGAALARAPYDLLTNALEGRAADLVAARGTGVGLEIALALCSAPLRHPLATVLGGSLAQVESLPPLDVLMLVNDAKGVRHKAILAVLDRGRAELQHSLDKRRRTSNARRKSS